MLSGRRQAGVRHSVRERESVDLRTQSCHLPELSTLSFSVDFLLTLPGGEINLSASPKGNLFLDLRGSFFLFPG